MITQVASKDANKLAYVLVEMVHKEKVRNKEVKTSKDIDKGLFEGILVHLYPNNSTRVYIVLSTGLNKTVMVDMERYNVLSLELYDGNTREYLFCRDTDEDQKAAFSELSALLNAMADVGKTVPGFDLVNLACYTDIPKHFSEDTAGTTNGTTSTSTNSAFNTAARNQAGFNRNHAGTSYVQHQATDPASTSSTSGTKTPTFFTRKSKLPHWKTLEQVKNKLKALAAGDKLDIPIPETDTTDEVYCSGMGVSRYNQNDLYTWD